MGYHLFLIKNGTRQVPYAERFSQDYFDEEKNRFGSEDIRFCLGLVDKLIKQGVYHLNINPGNFMRNAQGNLWLTDFGWSFFEESHKPFVTYELDSLAETDPKYLCPKVRALVSNENYQQLRADPFYYAKMKVSFSLGAFLYYAYTGTHPVQLSGLYANQYKPAFDAYKSWWNEAIGKEEDPIKITLLHLMDLEFETRWTPEQALRN